MHLRSENAPLCGRDHLSYRSYFFPVKVSCVLSFVFTDFSLQFLRGLGFLQPRKPGFATCGGKEPGLRGGGFLLGLKSLACEVGGFCWG